MISGYSLPEVSHETHQPTARVEHFVLATGLLVNGELQQWSQASCCSSLALTAHQAVTSVTDSIRSIVSN